MDLEKIFNDLESNQTQNSEEAKRILADCVSQSKEQWLVHNMMDYYLKTGSLRIVEVLVKVQQSHGIHILDQLSDWLKVPSRRLPALKFLSFVIRKPPTWIYKIEKHRLIKDIFKLLQEKEIVPLMSALLCIITLLPIIPNSVPKFFNDLCDVFIHLASWNCDKPNHLNDEKLIHLQLGLQMLFQRLYGMYPCNFLAYLSDFIKKDQKGAIYQHTIKPLFETVRLHPLLLTATVTTEFSSTRWKEMEAHDVVVECTSVTLPILYQDFTFESVEPNPALCGWSAPPTPQPPLAALPEPNYNYIQQTSQPAPWLRIPISLLDAANKSSLVGTAVDLTCSNNTHRKNWDDNNYGNQIAIWSPCDEFATETGPIPLTPTPAYMLPVATSSANNMSYQLMGITGSSPPEAAVEATPETTPMKDIIKDIKQGPSGVMTTSQGGAISNPNAVRAIFVSSQPSSPMRKGQSLFTFPEGAATTTDTTSRDTFVATPTLIEQDAFRVSARCSTNFDRCVQKVLEERTQSQSTFQTIEAQAFAATRRTLPMEASSKSETPEIDTEVLSSRLHDFNAARIQTHTPTQAHIQTPTPMENIIRTCVDCNETERSMCTAGGLHMATSHSMHLIFKDIKRRNRIASYSYNDSNYEICDAKKNIDVMAMKKVRRTKSCSSIGMASSSSSSSSLSPLNNVGGMKNTALVKPQHRRLQKSNKMLTIAAASKTAVSTVSDVSHTNVACQTNEHLSQSYENSLFTLLCEHKDMFRVYERKRLNPQQLLDQFIERSSLQYDQDQFQLISLQLQYERYRREIYAERNRRLMGRNRTKLSLEMECDRLRMQLNDLIEANERNKKKIETYSKKEKECKERHDEKLNEWRLKYQSEVDQTKCLRQANECLQTKLNDQLASQKDFFYELEALRGQIFNLTTELQQAQVQIDVGLQCKQELARLEAEFIVMGEVQVRCRDRLAEMESMKDREEEALMVKDSYKTELKDLKHKLEERTSQLDCTRHKLSDLQAQLVNCEKNITDHKRLLKAVKDEYEERFKALTKKYEVQKTILMQMEEKIATLERPALIAGQTACSPDTDRTDVASSMERNSPLSTSLASSESLSTSLRSTELRYLQQLAEANSSNNTINAFEGACLPVALDFDAPSTSSNAAAAAATGASASSVANQNQKR